MLSEHRLIRALLRQPIDRTPVWIMRQAGRYLPEYREMRRKAKEFINLCKTPELACEVTLQPLARFPLDAAIIFSDILTIPDAFQLGLHFSAGEGPQFTYPIRTLKDVERLPTLDPETELRYVMDAIRMTKKELSGRVPLIGFSGSPWTVATYMVEGQTSKNFSKIKKLMYCEPETLHKLLAHLTKTTVTYLNAQVAAGADVLMIFDTWGGILSDLDYISFSLDYMQAIVQNLNRTYQNNKIPVILFTKNIRSHLLTSMAETGCDAIGLDWTISLKGARSLVGHRVALQGNLDPALLYADSEVIQDAVKAVLNEFGKGNGHVFNLGHGIYPDVEPEKVLAMIEAVHSFSTQYHITEEIGYAG